MKHVQKVDKKKYSLVDKAFWALVIFYFDPGGFFHFYFENNIFGRIDFNDIFFLLMWACLFLSKGNYMTHITRNKELKRFFAFLCVWSLYLVFFYGLIIPKHDFNEFLFFLMKNRRIFLSFLLIIPIYFFSLRSLKIFVVFLAQISFVILFLFIFSFVTGLDIVPYVTADRRWVKGVRILMYSYGIMPLIVYYGIVFYLLRIRQKYRYIVFGAGIMMAIVWILSIFRREIFGMVIMAILYVILFYFFFRKVDLRYFSKLFVPSFIVILLVLALFPRYIHYAKRSMEEIYSVFRYGRTTRGKVDQRFSFNRDFMIDLIKKNPVLGNGFDYRWHTGEGDTEGFETSDYPVLSAFAMYGLIGLLIFSFYYFWLARRLMEAYVYFYRRRRIKEILIRKLPFEFLSVFVFVGYFVYGFLNVQNYFWPSLPQYNVGKEYFFLAIFLGAFYKIRFIFNREKNAGQG
jgi:hypothetical protein